MFVDNEPGARWPISALVIFVLGSVLPKLAVGHDFTALVAASKPSIVGIGTTQKTRRPPHVLMATGFVIGDGHSIVTNAHVIPETTPSDFEHLVIFVGTGRDVDIRRVEIEAIDDLHDIAILRQNGPPLPTISLATSERILADGAAVAFIGFPIGSVLGLYPVTHGGFVSAYTPIATPASRSESLSAAHIRALKNPYFVYQLDATAYPGNSGSPLFDANNGEVIGIINKVFIKSRKESVLSDPSDITYAIPVRFLHSLLNANSYP